MVDQRGVGKGSTWKPTTSKAKFGRSDTVACVIIRRSHKCPPPKLLQETSEYAS